MKCLCAGTRQVARLLTRHYEHYLSQAGITPAQFELLATLNGMGPSSQTALSSRLQFDQTTLSRNLKLLIAQHWIAQKATKEDRRKTIYSVTAAGSKILQHAMPLWQQAQSEIESHLGPNTASIWTALNHLQQALAKTTT